MKPIPDCVPDVLAMVLRTARIVSDDRFIHRKVLRKAMNELMCEPDFGQSSPELMLRSLTAAYKALGVKDPYEKEKARRNKAMLGLEKTFREYLSASPDPLSACLNLVLAGTVRSIDALGRAEMEREILEQLDAPSGRDDREALQKALNRAESIMYITDTAGEIVLDKMLIEHLSEGRNTTAIVASRPILTMATVEDAEAVNMGDVAEVTHPGAPMFGLTLEKASRKFRDAFDAADIVIVKGETHFETLKNTERDLYFLMQACDESVAQQLNVPLESTVFSHHAGKPGVGVGDTSTT